MIRRRFITRRNIKERLIKERMCILVLCMFVSILWAVFYYSVNDISNEPIDLDDSANMRQSVDTVIPDNAFTPEQKTT